MKNIITKEDLIEFSIKNSMSIEHNLKDRIKDITISIYDRIDDICDDRIVKIEGCDVTISFLRKRAASEGIRNIHFVNCNLKDSSSDALPQFFNCGFTNCKIDSTIKAEFLECLFEETEIKIEDRIANLLRFKVCYFKNMIFAGPIGWSYEQSAKNRYQREYKKNLYKFALSKMNSAYMIVGEIKKKIIGIYVFKHDEIDISATFFSDCSAIFVSKNGILKINNISNHISARAYFIRKMFFEQSLNDCFEAENFSLFVDASSIKELSSNLDNCKKLNSSKHFDNFIFSSNIKDDDTLSHQNQFRAIEYSLQNKFTECCLVKTKNMIRTIVLYSNCEYWVDKRFTGYDGAEICRDYSDSQGGKIILATYKGCYTYSSSKMTKKQFCEYKGIIVNPDDRIIVITSPLSDNAETLRGSHDNGKLFDLISEYYGEYHGKMYKDIVEKYEEPKYQYSYDDGPGRLMFPGVKPDRDW